MKNMRSYSAKDIAYIVNATRLPLPRKQIDDERVGQTVGGKAEILRMPRKKYILRHLKMAAALYATRIFMLDKFGSTALKKQLMEIEKTADRLWKSLQITKVNGSHRPSAVLYRVLETQAMKLKAPHHDGQFLDLDLVLNAISGVQLLHKVAGKAARKLARKTKRTGVSPNAGQPEYGDLVENWKNIFQKSFDVTAGVTVNDGHKGEGIQATIDSPFIRFCEAASKVIGLKFTPGSIAGYLRRNKKRSRNPS